MFQKLKQRWKVNGLHLALIIITFALGGSLCGYAGRKLLEITGLEKGVLWVILYVLLITLLWPLCVLLISIPLGQFGFFKRYINKIFSRLGTKKNTPYNIAIFASGAGSNAQQIINRFSNHTKIKVALIVCNKPGAGVLNIAKQHNIAAILIEKENFFNGNAYLDVLQQHHINFIILAGFLWKLPAALIKAYPKKIINIHPALLPAYGGKGMYGHFVHEAVITNKEKQSGITIHYADELYDHGQIITQQTCAVDAADTPETLAQRIHVLEHEWFGKVIEEVILNPRRGAENAEK
jgi:formyltetrahydrofolate-dependent phosphoribosylglycinamide formyltransferase